MQSEMPDVPVISRCLYHTPMGYILKKDMAQKKTPGPSTDDRERRKLIARIRRIRGQVEAVERSITSDEQCADILMLLANIRGGINGLMGEVLEDHIRHHLGGKDAAPMTADLAEDLIDLVRAYLK